MPWSPRRWEMAREERKESWIDRSRLLPVLRWRSSEPGEPGGLTRDVVFSRVWLVFDPLSASEGQFRAWARLCNTCRCQQGSRGDSTRRCKLAGLLAQINTLWCTTM